ncbi:MAG: uracil-DNA glycosylase family protein, partial [Planctomycetota bacterium]
MNPGPFGMAQTGVPFGEVNLVADWLGLKGRVEKPSPEHPKRPINGFDTTRSEVSGRRLWSWARDAFGEPDAFFERFFIVNYCPLVFMEESGKNRTPDKCTKEEREALYEICDETLRQTIAYMKPKWVIGVGKFAEDRAHLALDGMKGFQIGRMLHPSPQSPLANKGWAEAATKDLANCGIMLS